MVLSEKAVRDAFALSADDPDLMEYALNAFVAYQTKRGALEDYRDFTTTIETIIKQTRDGRILVGDPWRGEQLLQSPTDATQLYKTILTLLKAQRIQEAAALECSLSENSVLSWQQDTSEEVKSLFQAWLANHSMALGTEETDLDVLYKLDRAGNKTHVKQEQFNQLLQDKQQGFKPFMEEMTARVEQTPALD